MTQQHEPRPDDLLCATEVCRLLKISRRTFQRLRENGRLPPPVVQWNKTSMRWRRAEITTCLGPPLAATEADAALTTAARHITAATASAIAAGTHAAAAANALRHLQRKGTNHASPTQTQHSQENQDSEQAGEQAGEADAQTWQTEPVNRISER